MPYHSAPCSPLPAARRPLYILVALCPSSQAEGRRASLSHLPSYPRVQNHANRPFHGLPPTCHTLHYPKHTRSALSRPTDMGRNQPIACLPSATAMRRPLSPRSCHLRRCSLRHWLPCCPIRPKRVLLPCGS
jgi:hypothetical protein